MRRFVKVALSLSLMTLAAACASEPVYGYYTVNSKFVASAQGEKAPDIIPTPAYNQLAPNATTVAVRAPDRCSNSTNNQATGGATSAGAIMQTNCGVEMGEIERALTRAGYNVISWNVVARELSRNGSATDVAKSLGAQVLFQVNSLENSRKTLGQDARWERTYFSSNIFGADLAPLQLSDAQRGLLSRNHLAAIEAKSNPASFAVTLDAVAIWVPTGQSIWYYTWTHARAPEGVTTGYRVFLACLNMQLEACQVATPVQKAVKGRTPTTLAAGESVAVSTGERPEDRDRAIYSELFKDVVSNFVTSFAKVRA